MSVEIGTPTEVGAWGRRVGGVARVTGEFVFGTRPDRSGDAACPGGP